jgi:IS30 family transposase
VHRKRKQRKMLTPQDVGALWSRWKRGETAVQIGAALGRTKTTITWHLVRTGGLQPRERRRAARALTFAEREEISRGVAAGEKVRAIARRLGRSPSTVSRELRRNTGAGEVTQYRASTADAAAGERARRPKPCRLRVSGRLRRAVEQKLCADWSPQQIAQWLKTTYPGDPTMQISHETIYQSLYVQARGALKRALVAHLRRGQRYRRPRVAARAAADQGNSLTSFASRSGRRVPTRARCPVTGRATCSSGSGARRSRRSSNASLASCYSNACREPIPRRWSPRSPDASLACRRVSNSRSRGIGARRWRNTGSLRSPLTSKSTSVTPRVRGNEVRMRIPMAYCVSTFRKALTSVRSANSS